MRADVIAGFVAVVMAAGVSGASADEQPSAIELFNRRILPILQSDKPSSCAECHLGGVDLKDYIRSDAAKTFAALRKGGLVNVEQPDASKLLEFIQRAPEQPTLMSKQVREQEFAAFRAWITAASRDEAMLSATADEPAGPQVADEVVRHGRMDRVLASFEENIWSERHRCLHCHSPEFNSKRADEFGESLSWIVPNDPAGTLAKLIEYGQIDLDEPQESLILLKPTAQIKHRGGPKFGVGDRTYRQFLSFIEDYAAIVRGAYTSADQLPQPDEVIGRPSKQLLAIAGVPREYVGRLVRVEVFAANDRGEWSDEPLAISEWPVFEQQKRWTHPLTLLARRGTKRAERIAADDRALPPGRYEVRIFVDRDGKLAKDPKASLGEDDLVGQLVVNSQWAEGMKDPTVIDYPQAEEGGGDR